MVQKIRRFVTGHNAAGKAIVMIDDHAPNATEIKGWPGLGVTEVWVTDEMPVDNHGAERPFAAADAARPDAVGHHLPRRRDSARGRRQDRSRSRLRPSRQSTNKPSAKDSAKHPTMHKTNSIDYLVVISGSMHMLMEEGEVELHAGDCIVQRGTNHAWVNRSGKPCLLAAVLIDAKPAP